MQQQINTRDSVSFIQDILLAARCNLESKQFKFLVNNSLKYLKGRRAFELM
jgi:hypothetical protein